MRLLLGLIFLTGAYPLFRAWWANRRTSLFHAVYWAMAAWIAWGAMMVLVIASAGRAEPATASYLALALTGCAGVAVLGARRPGVGAWNFVVVGLLAVMLLPMAENLLAPAASLGPLRVLFLAATLAVTVLNYLPTRLAAAAVFVGAAGALQLLILIGHIDPRPELCWLCAAAAPWVALAAWRWRPRPLSEFDGIWLDFRDRFGFLWGQRVREQFNRSAAHAGWPVILRWHGLRLLRGASLPEPAVQEAIVATLRGLLKRFGAN